MTIIDGGVKRASDRFAWEQLRIKGPLPGNERIHCIDAGKEPGGRGPRNGRQFVTSLAAIWDFVADEIQRGNWAKPLH